MGVAIQNARSFALYSVPLLLLVGCSTAAYRQKDAATVQALMVSAKYSYIRPAPDTSKPDTVSQPSEPEYYRNAYDKAVKKADGSDVDVLRDIAYEQIKFIDKTYFEYKASLRRLISNAHLGFKSLSLALSAYGTVAAGTVAKTIASAVDTGVKGVGAAVDSEELESTAIDALQNQMDSDRQIVLKRIYDGINQDRNADNTEEYPLSLLESDLTDLVVTGDVNSALASLKRTTGANADTNKKKAEASKTLQAPSAPSETTLN